MEFTTSQLEAINTTDKNLLIIAGPGSGKTHTLVGRVVRLIENGIAAENIMVATFSEKAAKELITRVSNRLIQLKINVNLNEMYIGTLHSIFLRIIEEYREFTRLKRSYRLLDDFDQKFFVFKNLSKFNEIDDNELIAGSYQTSRWERVKNLIKYIALVSEENLNTQTLITSQHPEIQALGRIHQLYSQLLEEENCLDFSTIQTIILDLFTNHPEILSKLKDKIQYLMIDEYQDTNTIQEKIILLLSNGSNLCVVGDDDQGLYRFRGATIRNILEFKKNFPKNTCHQVILETNYRSHPKIINFYNEWMQRNTWNFGGINYRYEKQIVPPAEKPFKDYPAVIRVGTDGDSEDYFEEVYQFINHLKASDALTDYNQVAFLCKSVKNDKIIALANYLEERNIPIFSPRSALFFERPEIKLLLGAIIFIFPNLFQQLKWNDEAQLGIWDTYTEWRNEFATALQADPTKHQSLLQWVRKRAKQHLLLDSNTTYGFAALLYQLLEYPMFSELLEETNLNGPKNNLRAAYNIALLSKLLYKFEYLYNVTVLSSQNIEINLRNLFNTYFRFIIEGGIEEYEDFDEYAPSGCLSFMTIHQSKGLEFPVVMTSSLNLVPREQQSQLDLLLQTYYEKPPFEPSAEVKRFDFWRLFYTAFSRPQNLLVLTAHEKSGQGKSPSKYFEPVYRPLPDWRNESIDYSKIELETVRATNIKHEYSFTSHILLYENCPLQYKFYKDLEFVEVRTGGVLGGSLLHQTIEDIHKAVLRNEVQLLTNENITQWFNTNYFLLSKQQRAYLHQAQQKALLKQVLRYRDNNQHQWDRIKEAEVDVSLVKDSYILKGTIDLIKGENDTVELIDFKSGDKPDVNSTEPNTRRILQQYRRQLEVYAHLVEERTGQTVSKMHLYYPKEENSSPYISFRSNHDHIQATIESFDKVVSKIETKDFNMSHIVKSEKQCGNCDMRYHCNPKHYST